MHQQRQIEARALSSLFCGVACAALGLLSCGPAASAAEGPSAAQDTLRAPPSVRVEAPQVVSGTVNPEPAPEARASSDAFPETSLTPFARELHDVVLAALTGAPLPSSWPTQATEPVVDRRPGRNVEGLVPIGFAAEFRVYFTPPPGQLETDPDGVQFSVLLFEGGLRIVETELRNRDEVVAEQLPAWLAPFAEFTREVNSAARAGEIETYLETEAEVRTLFPPDLFQLYLERKQSRRDRRREAFAALAGAHGIRGYGMDDLVLFARGPGSEIDGFKLDVNVEDGGAFALRGPLVSAARLWPESDAAGVGAPSTDSTLPDAP